MFSLLGTAILNLFSKSATREYPFEKREPIKGAKGQIIIDAVKCDFCNQCVEMCPAFAITINKDEGIIEIDKFRCIVCAKCSEICHKKCIRVDEYYKTASYNKECSKFFHKTKHKTIRNF